MKVRSEPAAEVEGQKMRAGRNDVEAPNQDRTSRRTSPPRATSPRSRARRLAGARPAEASGERPPRRGAARALSFPFAPRLPMERASALHL